MAASDRPNVMVIQADQFRWDCLGVAGNTDVRTPHLNRLAADGVRYTNAFCTLPVCTPSRYPLLTRVVQLDSSQAGVSASADQTSWRGRSQ